MPADYKKLQSLAEAVFHLRSETMPVWIDDSTFAYLDDRSGVPHVYLAEVGNDEPRPLTSGDERIQTLIHGAGGTVVVGTDLGGNERQQLRLIDSRDGSANQLTSDLDRMFEPFVVSKTGESVVFRTNDGASGEFSLWSMDLASGERTCLWDDAGQVYVHDVSKEGDVLASLLTSNLDADLYIVYPDGSRQAILQVDDESWILDAAFAPHLGGMLVLTNAGRDFVSLELIDRETRVQTTLAQADGDVEAFKLSPNGSRIAWSVNSGGYSQVYLAATDSMAGARTVDLPPGVMDRLSWSPDEARLLFGWLSEVSPSRVYLVEDGVARPALADSEDDLTFSGVAPETISFRTFDGRDIPAFWFRATDGDAAPVVIDVHGGPEGQRRPGFHPILQYLVASGFNVLTTNVRGSTGYGKAYSHLDDVDRRLDSVHDLQFAHQWILEQAPTSAARVAVMGQSYGGFMTLSAVTEYPELWYAAIDVVGICNFVTFLERTGAWRRRHREAEYGSLSRDRELLTAISPIRKVGEIRAPLLVIHGRNDPRVPLYEAQQLVASLEDRDHPVELVVYDNEGHGLSKRANRIDGYARAAGFLWNTADDQAHG